MYVKKIVVTLKFLSKEVCAGSGKRRGENSDSTFQNARAECCPGGGVNVLCGFFFLSLF